MKRGSTRRGLTLIELLVVVGIVALLAGLVLGAGVSLSERTRVQQTQVTLDLLKSAVSEWRLAARREMTWWQFGDDPDLWQYADVHADTEEVMIISEILDLIETSDAARPFLAQIDESLIYRYKKGRDADWINTPREKSQQDMRFDGSMTVLDAWETPIYAIHPGRLWRPGDIYHPSDPDKTIRTYNEEKYGVAPNNTIVFVSAGPDRLFGLDEEFADIFGPERERAKAKARQDNLFSTTVMLPD